MTLKFVRKYIPTFCFLAVAKIRLGRKEGRKTKMDGWMEGMSPVLFSGLIEIAFLSSYLPFVWLWQWNEVLNFKELEYTFHTIRQLEKSNLFGQKWEINLCFICNLYGKRQFQMALGSSRECLDRSQNWKLSFVNLNYKCFWINICSEKWKNWRKISNDKFIKRNKFKMGGLAHRHFSKKIFYLKKTIVGKKRFMDNYSEKSYCNR